MKLIRRLLLFQTAVFAAFNELDLYNRPRKQRPNAPISYSEASDAPLEFSMLGDATQVQYDDEGDENELEEMMEQNPAASLTPVNMIMVRGAKHRKQKKQAGKTTPAPSTSKTTSLEIEEENENGKDKIARTAAEYEVKEIEIRIEDIVQEAKEWVFNNIGRNSQRDQLKAKRIVMRLDHLPIKYAKVIERCRSLEDAALIAERKKQRELEGGERGERMDKSEKELIKQERKAAATS